MDDIHDRHGDSETCNGQRTDTLAEEDSVTDVIEGGDDLRDDGRKCILPEQRSYGFGLKFFGLIDHRGNIFLLRFFVFGCAKIVIFYRTCKLLGRNDKQISPAMQPAGDIC